MSKSIWVMCNIQTPYLTAKNYGKNSNFLELKKTIIQAHNDHNSQYWRVHLLTKKKTKHRNETKEAGVNVDDTSHIQSFRHPFFLLKHNFIFCLLKVSMGHLKNKTNNWWWGVKNTGQRTSKNTRYKTTEKLPITSRRQFSPMQSKLLNMSTRPCG